ncbi:hypothetical protein GGS20DRAFT_93319 [Poronia punctata]|nr:hypothetical protein GGS20DRAFT_93319 [Poronia punctata]
MSDITTAENEATYRYRYRYRIPAGCHAIPADELDLRPDAEIDEELLNPPAISLDSEKNVFFFWHSGYINMHPYTKRNVRAYYRRLTKHGWKIYVIDRLPGSCLNIANFVDVHDPALFPQAFVDGSIGGDYAPQHTSDLVRYPLLLRYGGVYTDAGHLLIGDLAGLWDATVGNAASPWHVLSYNFGGPTGRDLSNYFFVARRNSPLFRRGHRLLLALWDGKTNTEGMHASPLLRGAPLVAEQFDDATRRDLTDYIIQGYCLTLVMGLVDTEDGWNGPEYSLKHIYAVDSDVGSQLINLYTDWNGPEAFRLMSLRLPGDGEEEGEDQKRAREVVENCLSRSFGFKLAHGFILSVFGETLGSLWRRHEGSDQIPGTYGHWLRHGMLYWTQDELPERVAFVPLEPYKTGPLLRDS